MFYWLWSIFEDASQGHKVHSFTLSRILTFCFNFILIFMILDLNFCFRTILCEDRKAANVLRFFLLRMSLEM